MVTATAILVAIAHDGSIGLALCLIEFPVPKKNNSGEVTAATVGCLNQEERTEKSSAAHV